eukprot:3630511-Amphidinium_carterae.3
MTLQLANNHTRILAKMPATLSAWLNTLAVEDVNVSEREGLEQRYVKGDIKKQEERRIGDTFPSTRDTAARTLLTLLYYDWETHL